MWSTYFTTSYLLQVLCASCAQELAPSNGVVRVPLSSPYEVLCLLDANINDGVDYIIFYRNEKLISNRYVTIFNRSSARLYLNSTITPDDRFYARLHSTTSHTNLIELSCTTPSAILGVSNFTCIFNDLLNLTCEWSVQNAVPTTYSVEYTPDSSVQLTPLICPHNVDRINQCTQIFDSTPSFVNTAQYLNFTVRGRNRFGTSLQTFQMLLTAIVTVTYIPELTFTDRTHSSIYIQWRIGDLRNFTSEWLYSVMVDQNFTLYSRIYHQSEMAQIGDVMLLNVTDLPYPNTDYRFQVTMKSALASNSLWSRPAIATIRTRPTIPYRPPTTVANAFQILSAYEEDRHVIIYWLAIPKEEHNGDDFYYEISVYEGNRIQEVIAMQPSKHNCQVVIGLKRYTFMIRSANTVGMSVSYSTVYVPAQETVLPPPLSVQIQSSNNTKLVWQTPFKANVTVAWCNGTVYHMCEELVDILEAPQNFLIMQTPTRPNNHMWVIVTSAISSSGLTMISHTIDRDQVGAIKNLKMTGSGSYDISIEWSVDYPETIPLLEIKGYIVYYCHTGPDHLCDEPERSFNVKNAKVWQAIVTNLEPYSMYRISVASQLKERVGSRSDFYYERTLETAPDPGSFQFLEKNVSNTWIELEWSPPSRMNGALRHYLVQYNDKKVLVHDARVMLTNLKSNTNYSIEVSACTIKCSQSIGPQIVRTKALATKHAEGVKIHKLNATHILLEWDTTTTMAMSTVETFLRIQFRDETANQDLAEEVIPVPRTKHENKISAVISVTPARSGG